MNARPFKVVDADDGHIEDTDELDLSVAAEHDVSLADDDDVLVTDPADDLDLLDDFDDAVADASIDDDSSAEEAQDTAAAAASARPVVPTSHPRVSEALRYLLDRYAMTAAREFPAAIAVVSALRKEGVTTVSHSLAEVLSVDFGYSVCSVDLSWAEGAPTSQRGVRSRLQRRRDRSRGGPRRPGILDVISGESTLDDVLITNADTKVAHLGAGSASTSMRELTRSVELHDVLDELRSRYEIVVFDNAPVAENSAALSLIQYAEAYVFVTQFGATTAHQVSEATRMLDPLPPMGAVLNSYRSRTPRAIRRFFAAER